MRSNLKGAIVEWVEHSRTKRRAPIRLDKRSMTFFARENDAEILEEPFASKNGQDVRDWLKERLKYTTDGNNLEWLPVVAIEHGGTSKHYYRDDSREELSESVEVEVKRYYIALTRDGREWRRLPWESVDPESSTFLAEKERYAESSKYGEGPKSLHLNSHTRAFRLPSFEGRGGNTDAVILPFTQDLWDGLAIIVKQIKLARLSVAELVSTKKGVAMVAEIGAGKARLMLASGPPL